MKRFGITTRIFGLLLGMDVPFTPVLAALVSSVGGLRLLPTMVLYSALVAVKFAILWGFIQRLLRPTERLHERAQRGRKVSETDLQRADRLLQAAPATITSVNSVATALSFGTVLLLHHLLVAPSELRSLSAPVSLLLVVTGIVGSVALFLPLLGWALSAAAGKNYLLAAELGLDLERPRRSVAGRLMMVGFCLVLAPLVVMTAALLAVQGNAAHAIAVQESRALAGELSHQASTGTSADPTAAVVPQIDSTRVALFVVDGDAKVESAGASLPPWATPELLAAAADGSPDIPDRAVALHALRLSDGRVVGSVAAMPGIDKSLVFLLVSVLVVLSMFGPIASWLLSRSLSGPLNQTAQLVGRATQQGDLSRLGTLPVAQLDEVGQVTQNLNQLLDGMRSIANAAGSVADGKLAVDLHGEGELQSAFRQMVNQLREVVQEMHSASAETAGAAAEIFAASQEQEAATTSHATGMTEISQTMDSLSDSAAHVASSVHGVLENAERTLKNTDQMVSRIDELTGHANRIGDILDVIKDIADRTDLLALNGSLEASRAGEAGVGFSLVASEMRRLAERVTGSVSDIKSLVADIRESGASTVVATEESKKLADGTTQAARSITLVTQQQQSSTEQVTQNVRSVAEVVQQSATSAAQTRSAAEGLKQQADRLATLVGQFELAG